MNNRAHALPLLAALFLVGTLAHAGNRIRKESAGPQVDACQVLTPDLLRKSVELPADIVGSTSKHSPHPLCMYRWPASGAEEKKAAWQKQMMANVQARKPMPKMPTLDNEVNLTWINEDKSVADAKAAFEGAIAFLKKGITAKARGGKITVTAKDGSALPAAPDATGQAQIDKAKQDGEKRLATSPRATPDVEATIQDDFVPVDGVGDQAAYGAKMRSLMVRHGKRRFTISARHEDGPAAELALARAVALSLIGK